MLDKFIECETNADHIVMMNQHVVTIPRIMLQLYDLIITLYRFCLIKKKQITPSFGMEDDRVNA